MSIDQAVRLVKELGFPIVVALFLLFFLVVPVKATVDYLKERLDLHEANTAPSREALRQIQSESRKQTALLKIICIGTARTPAIRSLCESAAGGKD